MNSRIQGARALAMARGALAHARRTACAPDAAFGRAAGRTARAAPSRCRSTPTTRPTSCATAASRSAGSSWGQYGNRVGVPRILKRARQVRRAGHVLRPGRLRAPASRRAAARRGRRPRDRHPRLDPRTQLDACPTRPSATSCCARPTRSRRSPASRPVGMRTPSWDFSPHTLTIEQEMGLALRLVADGRRGLLRAAARRRADRDRRAAGRVDSRRRGVLHACTAFSRCGRTRRRRTSSTSSAASSTRPTRKAGIFQLTMHPHVIGYRSRIWILEEIIRHARAKGDVWFATHAEVAAWARQNAVSPEPRAASGASSQLK